MKQDDKYTYNCVVCGNEKKTFHPRKKLCSKECKDKFYYKKRTRAYHISTASMGAVSELAVAQYFLLRGYAVFRALSPACFCDLIIKKGDETIFAEVRTGYPSGGKILYSKKLNNLGGAPSHFIVYVEETNEIQVIPI